MKTPGCPSCDHLDKDCGGHWSTKMAVHFYTGSRRPHVNLDVQEGNSDRDMNAYQRDEDV